MDEAQTVTVQSGEQRNYRYCPALKFKEGEKKALRELDSATRDAITPLIEIVPKRGVEAPSPKILADYLDDCARGLADCWGHGLAFFLDTSLLRNAWGSASSAKSLRDLLDTCGSLKLSPVPVVHPTSGRLYQRAASDWNTKAKSGLCLRIDLRRYGFQEIDREIQRLLVALGVTPHSVDLVFDCRTVSDGEFGDLSKHVVTVINRSERVDQFRSLILLAGAFPSSLAGRKAGMTHIIPRADWKLWRAVIDSPGVIRKPDVGDYGVLGPEWRDSAGHVPAPAVRYARESDWRVDKGHGGQSPTHGGTRQMHELCENIRRDPEYRRKDFSYGDRWIFACAHGGGTGRPQDWRAVEHSHHITLVARQISRIVGV